MVDLIVSWAIGFVLFATVCLTLIYFVRFKLRQRNKQPSPKHPTEGQYFRRFIPLSLRKKTEKQVKDYEEASSPHPTMTGTIITLVVTACFLLTVGLFIKINYWRFQEKIELTEDEKSQLKFVHAKWGNRPIPSEENVIDFSPLFKRRGLVFIKNYDDSIQTIPEGPRVSAKATDHWMIWAREKQVEYKICYWERIDRCTVSVNSHHIVVLPSLWQKEKIDEWLTKKHSVLLYGPPMQVLKNEAYSFAGIDFKPFKQSDKRSLIMVGDQRLTLGLDAGTYIDVNSVFNNFRAISKNADVLAGNRRHLVTGTPEAKVVSRLYKGGRLVWSDAPPVTKVVVGQLANKHLSQLYKNIFSFLDKREYKSIAMWPSGSKFAAFFEQDTEDKFTQTGKLIPMLKREKFPITWFVLSQQAGRHRDLTKELANVGEIACHGDNHDIFPAGNLYEQVTRLAECRKVLEEITGEKAHGFRPPEEKYNSETYDAVANNGFSYIFTHTGGDRATPSILLSDKKKEIVAFNRVNSDDFELWHKKKLSADQSNTVIENEVKWLKKLGGMYAFSFHSQFVNRKYIPVLENLIKTLKKEEAYATTGTDMMRWWLFRSELVREAPVSEELIDEFKPVVLKVNKEGKIERSPYRVGND